jgi:hypothetical protein
MSNKENAISSLDFFKDLDDQQAVYAVLDAARNSDIAVKPYEFQANWISLYKGEPEEAMFDVAPYLVSLGRRRDENKNLVQWIYDNLWGNSCGIFILSSAGLERLFEHLQTFLLVTDESGKPYYFRFYDPRVLRVYLPTCNGEELKQFFGPVSEFILEDGCREKQIRFSLSGETLNEKEENVF